MAVSNFKSVFLEMSIVTLWSVFPNPVTYVSARMCVHFVCVCARACVHVFVCSLSTSQRFYKIFVYLCRWKN